jgi:transcription factor E2F3
MKRRNGGEEEQDVEMNGWSAYANSDLSPAPTPSGARMRASRPKSAKQTKNGPQTPGPSGMGRAYDPAAGLCRACDARVVVTDVLQ